jgi:uncharacterized protein with HEPN domain
MSGFKSREWKFRIADILDSIEGIEDAVRGLSEAEFSKNRTVFRAVERELEIIGEASKHLPDTYTQTHKTIPWADIKGMRNILAHEYSRIDARIIWQVVEKKLPELKKAILPDDPRKN